MRVPALFFLIALTALPTAAQPPSKGDVIGSLLDPRHKPTAAEDEEPDVAGQTRGDADVEPPMARPGARPVLPRYVPPPPHPEPGQPIGVEETDRTPEGLPAVRDQAYEARILSSFAAAEGFLGPLDGGWTMATDRQDLYVLQLVDKPDRLEGVWRDPRRKKSATSSGLVDDIHRQGDQVVLRFTPTPGTTSAVATLHLDRDGVWRGDLEDAGSRLAVRLRRSGL